MPATATGILERSLLILREKASAQNLQEANITIRPHVGQAGAFDVKDKHQLYDAGVQAAQQQLPAILKLLKEKNITLSSAQHVGWAVKPNNILTVRRRFTQLNKYFFRFTSGNRSTA